MSQSKSTPLEKAIRILKSTGFNDTDYTISLSGPTIVFTTSGKDKLNADLTIKADLMHLGIKIM